MTRRGAHFQKGAKQQKKKKKKGAPCRTCCIFLFPGRHVCQTMGVGFSTSVFRQTELSKDPALLNIGLTYKRMDTRGACWVVSDFNTLQCSVYVGGQRKVALLHYDGL